jgi:polyisoprenoid-binding protein YceI
MIMQIRRPLTMFGALVAVAAILTAVVQLTDSARLTAAATPATTAENATTEEAKTYRIDPVHTSVIFGIRHLDIANVYGRFNDVSGTIAWDPDNPSNSSFRIEIKAESVDTNNRGRDDHLRNPDFFNVREFPTISFNSTNVERRGNAYRVTGNLNMHGVEREITLDLDQTGAVTHPRSGKHVIGLESHFTVKRSEHRMNYGIEQNMLGDEVKVIFAIEAIEQ